MPTYEYACGACGATMDIFQSIKDDPLRDCPECKAPALVRQIGRGAGLIFKGSGFYQTDYKKTSAPASESSSAPAPAKTEAPKPAASTAGAD